MKTPYNDSDCLGFLRLALLCRVSDLALPSLGFSTCRWKLVLSPAPPAFTRQHQINLAMQALQGKLP